MKRCCILAGILLILLCCISAQAEETPKTIEPMAADPETADPENGEYGIRIVSCDREKMDIRMYTTDLYEAEAVKALKSGDRIRIAGTVYTVSELADHGEDTLEIIPEEEFYGYLALFPYGETGYFYAVVGNDDGDWSPCTFAGEMTVALPLPDGFEYVVYEAGEEKLLEAQQLLERLAEEDGPLWFTQYNTEGVFRDGVLVRVTHSDYPMGPAEDAAAES